MSIDTDWATPNQVEDTIRLLDERGIKATFFSTGDYLALQELAKTAPGRVGPHPKLAGLHHKSCDFCGHLLEHRIRYPEASGYRCHGFCDSAWIQLKMAELGYTWESNACHHLESYLRPTRMFSGLVRFPVWLEDDVWLQPNHREGLEILEAKILEPGLKVFNFHPKHICENEEVGLLFDWVTEKIERWQTFEERMKQ